MEAERKQIIKTFFQVSSNWMDKRATTKMGRLEEEQVRLESWEFNHEHYVFQKETPCKQLDVQM